MSGVEVDAVGADVSLQRSTVFVLAVEIETVFGQVHLPAGLKMVVLDATSHSEE